MRFLHPIVMLLLLIPAAHAAGECTKTGGIGWAKHANQVADGPALQTLSPYTLMGCRYACVNEPRCRALAYTVSTKVCVLQSSLGVLSAQTGTDSWERGIGVGSDTSGTKYLDPRVEDTVQRVCTNSSCIEGMFYLDSAILAHITGTTNKYRFGWKVSGASASSSPQPCGPAHSTYAEAVAQGWTSSSNGYENRFCAKTSDWGPEWCCRAPALGYFSGGIRCGPVDIVVQCTEANRRIKLERHLLSDSRWRPINITGVNVDGTSPCILDGTETRGLASKDARGRFLFSKDQQNNFEIKDINGQRVDSIPWFDRLEVGMLHWRRYYWGKSSSGTGDWSLDPSVSSRSADLQWDEETKNGKLHISKLQFEGGTNKWQPTRNQQGKWLETNGGAISLANGVEAEIRQCKFLSNKAANGGAIALADAPSRMPVLRSAATIRNCEFTSNRAVNGGAIWAYHFGVLDITGCSFNANVADSGMSWMAFLDGTAFADVPPWVQLCAPETQDMSRQPASYYMEWKSLLANNAQYGNSHFYGTNCEYGQGAAVAVYGRNVQETWTAGSCGGSSSGCFQLSTDADKDAGCAASSDALSVAPVGCNALAGDDDDACRWARRTFTPTGVAFVAQGAATTTDECINTLHDSDTCAYRDNNKYYKDTETLRVTGCTFAGNIARESGTQYYAGTVANGNPMLIPQTPCVHNCGGSALSVESKLRHVSITDTVFEANVHHKNEGAVSLCACNVKLANISFESHGGAAYDLQFPLVCRANALTLSGHPGAPPWVLERALTGDPAVIDTTAAEALIGIEINANRDRPTRAFAEARNDAASLSLENVNFIGHNSSRIGGGRWDDSTLHPNVRRALRDTETNLGACMETFEDKSAAFLGSDNDPAIVGSLAGVPSLDACKQACLDHAQCYLITWVASTKVCTLRTWYEVTAEGKRIKWKNSGCTHAKHQAGTDGCLPIRDEVGATTVDLWGINNGSTPRRAKASMTYSCSAGSAFGTGEPRGIAYQFYVLRHGNDVGQAPMCTSTAGFPGDPMCGCVDPATGARAAARPSTCVSSRDLGCRSVCPAGFVSEGVNPCVIQDGVAHAPLGANSPTGNSACCTTTCVAGQKLAFAADSGQGCSLVCATCNQTYPDSVPGQLVVDKSNGDPFRCHVPFTLAPGAETVVRPSCSYCSGDDQAEVLCPRGFYCPNTTTKVPCPGLNIPVAGLGHPSAQVGTGVLCGSVWLTCPSGYRCPASGNGKVLVLDAEACRPGTVSTDGATVAHKNLFVVPYRYINPSTGIGVCSDCPARYFTDEYASLTCKTCPVGWNALFKGHRQCTACASGMFFSSAAVPCSVCPAGHWCPTKRYSALVDAFANATGVHRDVPDGTGPHVCPAGYLCPPASFGPLNTTTDAATGQTIGGLECPDGYKCAAQQLPPAVDCGPGTFCIKGVESACPSGWYNALFRRGDCSRCEVGRYYDSASTPCTACPKGYAQIALGQATCASCAAGRIAASDGLPSCTDCGSGQYQAQTEQSACLSCSGCMPGQGSGGAGGVCGGANAGGGCEDCPAGRFSISGLSCEACPSNWFQPGTGNMTCLQCTSCGVGKEPIGGGLCSSTQNKECAACGVGRYSDNDGVCKACAVGQFQSFLQSVACDECSTCGNGKEMVQNCSASADTQCQACGIGKYSLGSSSCTACAPGQFQDVTGEVQCKTCRVCGPGKEQEGGGCPATSDIGCRLCPAGTFSDDNGACKSCPEGRFQASDGGNDCEICSTCGSGREESFDCAAQPTPRTADAQCQPCGLGRYSDDGGACKECPDGRHQSSLSSTGCETCSTCGNGKEMAQNCTASTDKQCQPCGIGKYSFGTSSCSACPSGQYQNVTGQVQCKTCRVCGPGKEQEGGGCPATSDIGCRLCPAGTFSDDNDACKPCPEGRFQASDGGNKCDSCSTCGSGQEESFNCAAQPTPRTADTQCQSCGPGRYSDVTSACKACPEGRYQASENANTCVSCSSCGNGQEASFNCTGQAAPRTTDTQCQLCGLGTYSLGASACKSCAPGQYQDTRGQVGCKVCMSCPPGYTQAGGSCPKTANVGCVACDAGKVGLGGDAACTSCPASFYQAEDGKATCLSCAACSPGKAAVGGGCPPAQDTTCASCPAGFAQPLSGRFACDSCLRAKPVAKYQPIAAAPACEECPDPIGSAPAAGGASCECRDNYHNATVAVACAPCPAGGLCCRSFGAPFLRVRAGWWKPPQFQGTLFRCPVAVACLGASDNTCAAAAAASASDFSSSPNATGLVNGTTTGLRSDAKPCKAGHLQSSPLCALCQDGFKTDRKGVCVDCPSAQGDAVIGVLLLLTGWGLVFVVTSVKICCANVEKAEEMGGSRKQSLLAQEATVFISFCQVAASFGYTFADSGSSGGGGGGMVLPSSVLALCNWFSAASVDLLAILQDVVSPCAFGTSLQTKLIVRLLVLPVLVSAVAAAHALTSVLRRLKANLSHHAHAKLHRHASDGAVATANLIVFFLWPSIGAVLVRPFVCIAVGDEWYVAGDLGLRCSSADPAYTTLLALSVTGLVFVTLGIPLAYAVLLRRHDLHAPRTKARFGSLFEKYEPAYFYWELVVMIYKFCIASVVVVLSRMPAVQFVVAAFVAMGYTFLVAKLQPYHEGVVDSLDQLTMVSTVSVLVLGYVNTYSFQQQDNAKVRGLAADGGQGKEFVEALCLGALLVACLGSGIIMALGKRFPPCCLGSSTSNASSAWSNARVMPITRTMDEVQHAEDGEKEEASVPRPARKGTAAGEVTEGTGPAKTEEDMVETSNRLAAEPTSVKNVESEARRSQSKIDDDVLVVDHLT